MDPTAKLIIILGLVLVIAGLFWNFGARFLHLGRLPGDISIEKPNVKFYFPLTTSIIISILLTLAFWIYSRLKQ